MKKVEFVRFFPLSRILLFVGGVVIFELFLLLFIVYGLPLYRNIFPPTYDDVTEYADYVIDRCEDSHYRPSCYDEEIPRLYGRISMEEGFELAKIVQSQDSEYLYCHVLGHRLGSLEVKHNPSKWKDVVSRCPLMVCANGCHHGALQEHFRTEYLADNEIEEAIPEFRDICEDRPERMLSEFQRANCYHGLGHMILLMTNGDIEKAIDVCSQVSEKGDGRRYHKVCYDGIFMQFFQSIEPEDIALVQGKVPSRSAHVEFCTELGDEVAQQACYIQGWYLYKSEIANPDGFVEFCARGQEILASEDCSKMLFYNVAQIKRLNPELLESFCASFDDKELISSCFSYTAGAMLDAEADLIPQVLAYCEVALAQHGIDACYQKVSELAAYNYLAESPEYTSICEGLPEPWLSSCFDGR